MTRKPDCHVYRDLDASKREIRLLEIQDVLPDDPSIVQCRLRHIVLDDNPIPFSAISYMWGASGDGGTLKVDGKLITVTESAWEVLDAMRSRSRGELFWIDTVCIDQSNTKERNHQVMMMRDIYSSAERVYVWLGRGTKHTLFAMEMVSNGNLVDTITTCRPFLVRQGLQSRSSETRSECMQAIYKLQCLQSGLDEIWRNPYWNRLWIVQEIVLAKEVYVIQGGQKLSWDELRQVAPYREQIEDYLREIEKNGVIFDHPELFRLRFLRTAPALLTVIKCRDQYHKASQEKRKIDLKSLLELHNHRESTNPRDMVYGLLGLSEQQLGVDYAKHPSHILLDVLHACIVSGVVKLDDDDDDDGGVQGLMQFSQMVSKSLGITIKDEHARLLVKMLSRHWRREEVVGVDGEALSTPLATTVLQNVLSITHHSDWALLKTPPGRDDYLAWFQRHRWAQLGCRRDDWKLEWKLDLSGRSSRCLCRAPGYQHEWAIVLFTDPEKTWLPSLRQDANEKWRPEPMRIL
ncbi:heterokaryon incompatibility protein-domain-containing protein [Cladorrhinum sp. PSN332]|nr:heterokaryon incompatibility protein-domain-containing protein [Cladorrhinum sp. PSN332]